jgi:AcrR family transcriptional regulator
VPKLTPARSAAQRVRILDAALTCFAREGFHAATMQDIFAESGLSPGAVYGYFKSKTAMVLAIASARHAMERERMAQALAAGDIDLSTQLLVESFVLALRDPGEARWRRLAVQLWAESLSTASLLQEALHGVDQAVETLSGLVGRAQAEGRWPAELDPASAARVMIAVLQGISLQLAWDDDIDMARFAAALRIMLAPAKRPDAAEGLADTR